jgi:hypothetical protein
MFRAKKKRFTLSKLDVKQDRQFSVDLIVSYSLWKQAEMSIGAKNLPRHDGLD